ncbi:HNH endonuclease-domain-containing protein [Tuber brumale]|nr:HNH endonuclease-domain-containing protein [Tuber brumale]
MASTDQDRIAHIQPADRSAWHNTRIYASNDRDTVLGGLWVAPGITNTNLYSMVNIFCTFTASFDLQDGSQQLVEKDEQPLRPGALYALVIDYHSLVMGSIAVTNEVPLLRTLSLCSGTRVDSFFESVRNRDERCVITGRPAVISGVAHWTTFEAAHVFPLAYEEHWNKSNFSHWITVPPDSKWHGAINSVQNGILLTRDMHALFDSYELSINPDDDHKIVCFTPFASSYGIAD